MKRLHLISIMMIVALASLSGLAQAHTGEASGTGFMHGFGHPLGGVDHLLAMMAVGLWAGQLDGAASWRIPLAFVAMMVAGGVAGMLSVPLPMVESGIIGSLIVLGALIALATRLPVAGGMALVGLFAVFHGHAHGMEMPATSGPLLYATGFVAATVLLHAMGVALSLGLQQGQAMPKGLIRVGGGAIAAAGIYLVAGF